MSTRAAGASVSRVALVTPPSDLDYGTRIATILDSHRSTPAIERFDPASDAALPPPDQFDLVIVTGSTARVHQPDPWIDELATHLRELVAARTPVVGVCFGHQLLAASLGGTVDALPARAAGFRTIESTDDGRSHPLFAGLPARFTSFLWHRDHVTRLPADAFPLARNETGIQAFSCKNRPAAGIQFHPEVGLVGARTLAATRPRRTLPDNLAGTLTDAASTRAARTHRIYENAASRLKRSNSAN